MTGFAPGRRSSSWVGGQAPLAAFADAAAFAVVLGAAAAVPVVFSIAQPDVFAQPKTELTVTLAVLLIALLAVRWLALGAPVRVTALGVALVAFVCWNGLAAWLAIDQAQALAGERLQYQGLATLLAYVAFLLGARVTVHGPRRRTQLAMFVTAGAIPVTAYALLQRADLDPIWPTLHLGRVYSTIGQANALAAYLVMTIPFAAGLAAGRNLGIKAALVGLVGLMVLALALTLSRGGYLGALAMALVGVAAFWRPRWPSRPVWRQIGSVVLLGSVALVGVLMLPDARSVANQVAKRALSIGDPTRSSNAHHLDLWAVGVAITADHPILGTGQDTYVLVFPEYRDDVLSPASAASLRRFRPESPHNVYLAVADGAGLPALAAYLALITLIAAPVLLIVRGSGQRNARVFAAVILAAIAGHVVTDFFMTAETTGSLLFWTTLGAGLALASDVPDPHPATASDAPP